MKIIHNILIHICFLISWSIWCQTSDQVMKSMITKYTEPKPLKFEIKYNLYKNHLTNVIHESYLGSFMKNSKNEVLMKVGNNDIVTTTKYVIQVDHKHKTMLINNAPKSSSNLTKDIENLVRLCEENSFKDYKDHWEITYVPKQFSGLLYSKILLKINKDYTLKKQVFYYNTKYNFSRDYKKDSSEFPRLEMIYNHYNRNVQLDLINSDLYVKINNKTAIALPKYKSYKIFDSRK
ncbi:MULTISPECIES: hypothetical protein [Flavobacterium]|uniref:GLPGLI family protein n=1 Tax=Flavobacterium covae TaxID=2906076 RepID=A0ABW8PEH6_9FLAO|nr:MULTISPECIES: hypothetical protein [Flavobacterium]AND64161.1 hypothetical protein AX766_06920 [Flavobacterium covae]MCJ1806446.1 hypothetical protein [Flavobacterium covae]MCJ1809355.1 hypothetical protein [Flavobacterium covae]